MSARPKNPCLARMSSDGRGAAVLAVAAVAGAAIAALAGPGAPPDASNPAPEESRLGTTAFRAGLKERGLTELLELHVKDFPPADPTEAQIILRQVKLAQAGDATRSRDERRAAAADANNILERLIAKHGDDPRRFEWRFDLARSLLYDEAEPFITSILYRGGCAEDRRRAAPLTARAVATLTTLVTELGEEYERIDKMAVGEFERLDAEGYVERLDELSPRAEYLLLWALLYDSLPREEDDPTRAQRLNDALERLARNPALLTTPHEISHVQVQTLLLAGIAHRLLNNHQSAREHFNRALEAIERLDDQDERRRIDWAVTLVWLERIRNEAGDERFDEALRQLAKFSGMPTIGGAGSFRRKVTAALLERSIYRLRALASQRAGQVSQARSYRRRAWRPLAQLARSDPDHRDELYAVLFDITGPDADPADLDPFEQCALIAGLLSEGGPPGGAGDSPLDRAVEVGERFLAEVGPEAPSLVPEVLYNVAVAEYRRGRPAAAAERFLRVAKDHRKFSNAQQAAAYAVQLAAELYGDPSLKAHPGVRRLYRDTLEVLTTQYADTDAARYWRFYYARLLEELGEYHAAADQYALVDSAHEHRLESLMYRARCLAFAVQRGIADGVSDARSFQQGINAFFAAQREFVTRASGAPTDPAHKEQVSLTRSLLAEARLLAAEIQALPQTDRPAQALETLTGFENEYPGATALAGRVWRVRLVAYEKLGRLDEAALAAHEYIAADPNNAGATLQALYNALSGEVEELQTAGDTASAQRRAEMALMLAEEVQRWATRPESATTADERRALTVQLAEANLSAGRYARAGDLFETLSSTQDGSTSRRPLDDVRVVFGRAEALFRSGELAPALAEFNRLATGLPPTDPIRWKALLRDLQCRTMLKQPPSGIVKVIRQQKQLYSDLGGPLLASQFEKLLRKNERRRDEGS